MACLSFSNGIPTSLLAKPYAGWFKSMDQLIEYLAAFRPRFYDITVVLLQFV